MLAIAENTACGTREKALWFGMTSRPIYKTLCLMFQKQTRPIILKF